MADAATVSVLIQAKDNASREFKNVEGNMGKMVAGIQKHRRAIGIAMTAMGAAITGIAVLSVKSSLDQQVGINRLDQSLKNVGTSYANQKIQIEKVVAAQQLKTNYGDEAQREALQKLVTIGGKWEGSLAALKITTDVAAGANIDLNAAALLVGKAIAGETSSLSRYGITLEEGATQTEIMAKLTKQFGGAAEAAADPITQMKNRMGDLFQVIGDALLPIIEKLVPMIEGMIRQVIEWAEAHPTLTRVLAIVVTALGGLMLVLGPVLLILPQLVIGLGIFRVAIMGVGKAIAANPIGAILTVLTTLALVVLPLVLKNWESIWNNIQKFSQMAANFIIGILNKLTFIWRNQVALILDFVGKLLGVASKLPWVGDKFKAASEMIDLVSEKLQDGIPEVDFYTEKQAELQEGMKETADEAADTAKVQQESITRTADVIERQSGVIMDSWHGMGMVNEELATATEEGFERMRIAAEEAAATLAESSRLREVISDLNKQAALEEAQAEVEAQKIKSDAFIQGVKDKLKAKEQEEASQDRSLDKLRANLDATNIAWKESGRDMEDVVKAWSKTMDISIEEVLAEFDRLNIDTNNVKETLRIFTRETGADFLQWADDVDAATQKASEALARSAEAAEAKARREQESLEAQILKFEGITVGGKTVEEFRQGGFHETNVENIFGKELRRLEQLALDLVGQAEDTAARLSDIGGRIATAEVGSAQEAIRFQLGGRSVGTGQTTVLGAYQSAVKGQLPGGRFAKGEGLLDAILAANPDAALGSKGAIEAAGLGEVFFGPEDGKQGGGWASGRTLVGERGPEIVNLPRGSYVNSHGAGGGMGTVNQFHFHGAVYGVEDLKEAVVEAVRDHAISGGFSGVFAEA